jgi:CRP-like cAMP-binding protein
MKFESKTLQPGEDHLVPIAVDKEKLPVVVTNEVVEHAIRRLFADNASSGGAFLDARVLHRLWKKTGLRLDDLADGLRSLTDSGALKSTLEGKNFLYMLNSQLLSDAGAAALQSDRLLDQLAARARPPAPVPNLNPGLDRRNSDKPRRASGEKRRSPKNRLLEALPKDVYATLQPQLQLVRMPLGNVVWEPGDTLDHVFFPVDCIFSLVQAMSDGSLSKIATVGNEGMLGLSGLLSDTPASSGAIILHAGFALRLDARILQGTFASSAPLQRMLLRYFQAFLMQVAQTSACNRHHSLDQQLCRLLLESTDRLRSKRLTMTHETIASMLGVRRVGITESIGKLKQEGSISSERGAITLINRQALVQHACECYAAIRGEFDRMRPPSANESA